MTTSNIPQEIQDKATAAIAKGSTLTFEAACALFMKSSKNKAKKLASDTKWNERALAENITPSANPSVWLAEKNRENAMKNLPSSLR